MVCFIKDAATFVTKKILTVSKHDIVLASSFNDKSKITVLGAGIREGDFACCDNGYIGIIDAISPNKQGTATELICIEMLNLFNTWLQYYDGFFDNGIEYMLALMLELTYTNTKPCLPYGKIRMGNVSYNYGRIMYPDVDRYYFNIMDYLNKAKLLYGIHTTFSIGRTNGDDFLKVNMGTIVPTKRKIDFSDKSFTLISETHSREAISKVEVAKYYEETESADYENWYIHDDGSISTSSAERADGMYKLIFINNIDVDRGKEAAKQEFAKNIYSHSIEFSTKKKLSYGDLVEIRINGRVLHSSISSVRVASETDRYIYKSGELRTNLDKLKEMI